MNVLAVQEIGSDVASIVARLSVGGFLAASEAGVDRAGSSLMQQIARALGPLAAGGAWPGRNTTEPAVYPYISFLRVINSSNLSFDGPSDMQATRIQVDSFGVRYGEASDLNAAVQRRMLQFFVIGSIDEQDFPPDPDTYAFRCSTDFNIFSTD